MCAAHSNAGKSISERLKKLGAEPFIDIGAYGRRSRGVAARTDAALATLQRVLMMRSAWSQRWTRGLSGYGCRWRSCMATTQRCDVIVALLVRFLSNLTVHWAWDAERGPQACTHVVIW